MKVSYAEKLGIGIAVVSLVASLTALYFSYDSFLQNQENLLVEVKRILEDDYLSEITQFPDKETPAMIATRWGVLVSNRSNLTISIKNFASRYNWNGKYFQYVELRPEFTMPDGLPAIVPLKIPPGESVVLSVNVKLLIPQEPYDLLRKRYDLSKPVKMRNVVDFLSSNGLSLLGSHVYERKIINSSYSPYPITLWMSNDKKNMSLTVTAETTRGARFEGEGFYFY